MTDQIIVEWLSTEIDPANVQEFAESLLRNEDIFQAVTHVLEENERFKPMYIDVIGTIFSYFRSSEKKLKLFASQFIPTLIFVYLQQIHSQKKCVALETLLSGIFELVAEDKPISTVRIPNVNLPSIYHETPGLSASWLSDKDLERLNNKTIKLMNRPTLELTEERVRAPQRLPLCVEIWWYFNHRLTDLPIHAVPTFLKTISKLVTRGFTNSIGQLQQSRTPQSPARIALSSKLVIEMVHTIFFSIYSGAPTLAEQVLEETLARANYQLWADAIMVCLAVQNYLKSSDIPLQVEPTTFKKSIITNASFRTKKLPDDIPIIESESNTANTAEDTNDGSSTPTTISTSLLAKSKSKLPNILAKIKRNSVVVINEETGEAETTTMSSTSTPPESRKKSIDSATAV